MIETVRSFTGTSNNSHEACLGVNVEGVGASACCPDDERVAKLRLPHSGRPDNLCDGAAGESAAQRAIQRTKTR